MNTVVHLDSAACDCPLPVVRVLPPDGTPTGPPVVLAPHRDGVDEFVLGCAARLAEAGLPVYAPDVYHGRWSDLPARERKARLDDDQLRADLEAVADLVDRETGRAPAVLGFCMGGRIAALAATALDRYRLAVSCYGGDLDKRWGRSVTTGGSPMELAALGRAAPIELHHGRADTNPAPDTVRAMVATLQRAGTAARAYDYDAGHAFCNWLRPEVHRPEAAELAWSRILDSLSAVSSPARRG